VPACSIPEYIGVTPASNHDLSAFRQITPYLHQQNAQIYTPVKKKKSQENLYLFEQLWAQTLAEMIATFKQGSKTMAL